MMQREKVYEMIIGQDHHRTIKQAAKRVHDNRKCIKQKIKFKREQLDGNDGIEGENNESVMHTSPVNELKKEKIHERSVSSGDIKKREKRSHSSKQSKGSLSKAVAALRYSVSDERKSYVNSTPANAPISPTSSKKLSTTKLRKQVKHATFHSLQGKYVDHLENAEFDVPEVLSDGDSTDISPDPVHKTEFTGRLSSHRAENNLMKILPHSEDDSSNSPKFTSASDFPINDDFLLMLPMLPEIPVDKENKNTNLISRIKSEGMIGVRNSQFRRVMTEPSRGSDMTSDKGRERRDARGEKDVIEEKNEEDKKIVK